MKTESVYEIVDTRTQKQRELIFWATMAIKEMEKLNKLLDEAFERCRIAQEAEENAKDL